MNDVDDTARYTIGELARRTGLSVKTIRFYSDSGVVPPTDRTAAGYRRYDVTAVSRLELVRTLRELGAGLDEVQRVLADETSLSQLATVHLGLLEEQLRVLQTRRAVLRAVVKLDRSTEEARIMHKLARLSDEERNRLIDEFWDEVSSNLNITPGFTEWLRSAKPNLPDDPSAEQLEAWIELAELVRDPDFRRAVRELYQQHSDIRDAGEELPVNGPEKAPQWWAITDEAKALADSGAAPDSAEAGALVERLVGLAVAEWGEEDTAEFRGMLADYYENHDERMSRYWELLATINDWPKHPVTSASTNWLAEALRASTG